MGSQWSVGGIDSAAFFTDQCPLTTDHSPTGLKPTARRADDGDTARHAPRRRCMLVPVRPPTAPSVRLDLTAFALLAVGLLVALSVFSADPPDPSGAWRDDAATANLLGPAGQLVARQLLDALGASVHVLLAAWFVLVV